MVYAGHIVALGRISTRATVLGLSLVQLATIAVVCTGAALWPTAGSPAGIVLPDRPADWLIVVYLAVLAGAVTMVLQTWAQARVEPTRAAVIMAMEPVWAAGFAVALGGESMTLRMIIGGLAILTAMYLVELAPRHRSRPRTGVRPMSDLAVIILVAVIARGAGGAGLLHHPSPALRARSAAPGLDLRLQTRAGLGPGPSCPAVRNGLRARRRRGRVRHHRGGGAVPGVRVRQPGRGAAFRPAAGQPAAADRPAGSLRVRRGAEVRRTGARGRSRPAPAGAGRGSRVCPGRAVQRRRRRHLHLRTGRPPGRSQHRRLRSSSRSAPRRIPTSCRRTSICWARSPGPSTRPRWRRTPSCHRRTGLRLLRPPGLAAVRRGTTR